jgi:hypothetical protein
MKNSKVRYNPPIATPWTVIGQQRVNAKPDDLVVIGLFPAGALHLHGLMLAVVGYFLLYSSHVFSRTFLML